MNKKRRATGHRREHTSFEVSAPTGLLDFLLRALKNKSRTKVKALLAHRQVTVDGTMITQFDHPLEPGQTVCLLQGIVADRTAYPGLNIIFEDSSIIIVDKKAGLLSIATDTEKEKTAHAILNRHVRRKSPKNKVFIVHRLDRDASGIMIFAKSREIKDSLQKEWRRHERVYAALVEGRVVKNEGRIESWIMENDALTMYSSDDHNGAKKAVTCFRVLERTHACSLLEIRLETGRKNQIRVHMKEMGHSIIGDVKYGAKTNPAGRLGLHARKLCLRHPVTGTNLCFESPVPESLLKLCRPRPGDRG